MKVSQIWAEKYRPATLNDYIDGSINKEQIRSFIKNPDSMPHLLFVSSSPGTGKCLGKGTPILMYDGSIKNVEDMKNGDLVMGADSTPRIVSGVTSGIEQLYEIEQLYGNNFIVNESHILSLISNRRNPSNKITNVSVKDYLKFNPYQKHIHKGYKTKIDFKKQEALLDPYFLGVWLGDGSSHAPHITTKDKEIVEYLTNFSQTFNLKITEQEGKGCKTYCLVKLTKEGSSQVKNPLTILLEKINVLNNKHIPLNYKLNDKETRLQLLAGLLDTDGSITCEGYEITNKSKDVAEDICFIARSLGFRANLTKKIGKCQNNFIGEYYRVHINGPVWEIPLKIKYKQIKEHKRQKNCLRYGISVKKLEIGQYFGFEVDKDGLFVLGDFTVTHNTSLAKIIINDLQTDALVLNSSMDRKIETIRERIVIFASTMNFNPNAPKIIFMDEFDGMPQLSQEALRNVMEEYVKNCRFILTANNEGKVIDPIKSRCLTINFSQPKKESIKNRIVEVLTAENAFMCSTDKAIDMVIDNNYPNIRNCLISLQSTFVKHHKITEDTVNEFLNIEKTIYTAVKAGDYEGAKKLWMDNGLNPYELLHSLFRLWEEDTKITIPQKKNGLLKYMKASYQMSCGANPEIQLTGLFLELVDILSSK